ncbi:protein TONSOKU [Cynara cardunculus var. scolymus]|uniref:protein TONSOKU n=1 Tax=Cynara cardunculus var. scolymus TaxID=59895 RepID=UPI000D628738|nr:protein TONSOKU [Cynara cardunculus var. scolymus]
MKKEDVQLTTAKRAYRNASEEGNRQEEARWANVIGDILKNRGEYVEALRWFRLDYEVSIKYLPEKQLLPTCQSLGEVYLRLEHFKDALIYQKKHLELARDTNDMVEQQRASTQLGRTYHEMFLKSDNDQTSLRNAKKYFISAMKLAQTLKENPQSNKYTFLKEYIDSHNNIGMVEMDLDNLEEAENVLTKGLQICDEEEVVENDDGRTRLHHNLGNVYMELRRWDKARKHIEKDIVICKNIGHCQGEAKGYINLGELHYRVQKYEEATLCYQKAMNLAKSMDDEHALANQIDQNIEVVKEAIKVMEDLKKEEQNLKKLTRNIVMARGTSTERKCLLQQNASLDRLIEKSSIIFAWKKHCEFAKKKKKVASELCDKEKLGDSYLVIGESYQKLRNFNKAQKWYSRSWETYKSIGNMEGQALAKINLGDVLDSVGKWANALDAFSEGYSIARQANLLSVQLYALENMHYSYMIRFDNVEEARRLQSQIDKLKQSNSDNEPLNVPRDCCSETDTEGDDISLIKSDMNYSPRLSDPKSYGIEELADDSVPLVSLLRSNGYQSKSKGSQLTNHCTSTKSLETSPKSMSRSTCSQTASRKRCRLVLSDDEDENKEVWCPRGQVHESPEEHVATSNEFKGRCDLTSHVHDYQDISPVASKCAISASTPVHLEESTSSHKGRSSKLASSTAEDFRCSRDNEAVYASHFGVHGLKCDDGVSENTCKTNGQTVPIFGACDDEYCKHMIFKVEDDFVHIEPRSCKFGDKLCMEQIKVEVACLYFLKLIKENRSRGLLPIIQHLKCGGEILETLDVLDTPKDYMCGKCWVEVSIDRWVPKRLVKLYVDCCNDLSEPPNVKLLTKLYNLEVSEDEIVVSDCELQDISAAPLLNALHLHKTVATLNLSHNLLGNETMEKLKQVFMSSSQKYGGLVLDLHCNRFGPTSLFQICECPVLLSRLEVLNISGNRLTDGCASYLSTILQNCKALYSLNIECCSITSRTIQKVTDSLDSESLLSELFIGYNSSISGNAIVNLLDKLATLKSFSQLSLNGIKLNKNAVDSLCKLIRTSCLSELMIGDTSIGTERATQLMDSWNSEDRELVKLDLSSCLLTSNYIMKLNIDASLIGGILELNLGGNPLTQEGGIALASLLKNPHCCLKVVVLNKCQLGLVGVLGILQSLSDYTTIEELNLSENALHDEYHTLNDPNSLVKGNDHVVNQDGQQEAFGMKADCIELEVAADSEDDEVTKEKSCVSGSCMTSFDLDHSESNATTFIGKLSYAILMAKRLVLLDLSNNGLCGEAVYGAWSKRSTSSGGLTERHIEGSIIHLAVEPRQCCNIKPCCRRF